MLPDVQHESALSADGHSHSRYIRHAQPHIQIVCENAVCSAAIMIVQVPTVTQAAVYRTAAATCIKIACFNFVLKYKMCALVRIIHKFSKQTPGI